MAAESWASTTGLRVRWLMVSVPVYAIAWAAAQAMGEVVGEAWGGAFLHALGHTIGTVLLVGLLAVTGWLLLRHRVEWSARWAVAGTIGSVVGLALYVPILAMAPDDNAEFTIALTLHLPLIMAAIFQARALRGRIPGPVRWAVTWFFATLVGVGAAWFAGGGLSGAVAESLFPVLESAVIYWWDMIPRSLLGGLLYAAWTALAVPLHRPAAHVD